MNKTDPFLLAGSLQSEVHEPLRPNHSNHELPKLARPPLSFRYPCGSAGKESICNAGDLASIPGLGRSPGEGKGYPLQYSGLENCMDCIVHEGRKESDGTERLSLSLSTFFQGFSGGSAVSNLPAIQQTRVQPLGREDPL